MKRLFIIHGWGDGPKQPMLSSLEEFAKGIGFDTTFLRMPNPTVPTIDSWTKYLEDNVYYVDQDTYFIGHSLGGQAILRYLEMNKGSQLGGAILIAPAFIVSGLKTQEDQDIFRPWKDRPIDFTSIRSMSNNFVTIFSDNDQSVPFDANKEVIEKGLGQKIIVEHAKGHFCKEDDVVDLPVAKEILEGWK